MKRRDFPPQLNRWTVTFLLCWGADNSPQKIRLTPRIALVFEGLDTPLLIIVLCKIKRKTSCVHAAGYVSCARHWFNIRFQARVTWFQQRLWNGSVMMLCTAPADVRPWTSHGSCVSGRSEMRNDPA